MISRLNNANTSTPTIAGPAAKPQAVFDTKPISWDSTPSRPGSVDPIPTVPNQSSIDRAQQYQQWKDQLDNRRLPKRDSVNLSGAPRELSKFGLRNIPGKTGPTSNVATNKLRQNPQGLAAARTEATAVAKTGAGVTAGRTLSTMLRVPGKTISKAAKTAYYSAGEAADKMAEDPTWTGMWILIFSFSIFGDMVTFIPFVGNVISVIFSLTINLIYLIFGYYKKQKFGKGAINLIAAIIELVTGIPPTYIIAALINFAWMSFGNKQLENATGEED